MAPCGCSGGTWQPPDTENQDDADVKPGQTRAPVTQPQPAQVGPAAPGYYHGPDR